VGTVAIDPALVDNVTGTPTIEVVDVLQGGYGELFDMVVSNIQAITGGFSFHAQWPNGIGCGATPEAGMTVKTTFQIQCPDNSVKTVESYTNIHLCVDVNGTAQWVSSGEQCCVCYPPVCEMAPSPIVPAAQSDDLPLARALELAIATVARIGRSLILLAENDGGPGLDYEWEASAGEVRQIAPDVVVWTVPPTLGPHLLKVAAVGPDTAAVASLVFDRKNQ